MFLCCGGRISVQNYDFILIFIFIVYSQFPSFPLWTLFCSYLNILVMKNAIKFVFLVKNSKFQCRVQCTS